MDWHVEDYYFDNHSEFDAQVDELKESLKKAVKQEHIDEMNRIKKENEELQEVKKNFEAIKQNYARKEQELEHERRQLLFKVRQERLSDLLKESEVTMFKARANYVDLPKCDRCDDFRRIHFKSPLGNMMSEQCSCKKNEKMYIPEKMVRTEFKVRNHESTLWYKPYRDSSDGMVLDEFMSSEVARKIFKKGDPFAKLNKYETFFVSEKDCLEYCEYLNNANSNEAEVEYEFDEIDL